LQSAAGMGIRQREIFSKKMNRAAVETD